MIEKYLAGKLLNVHVYVCPSFCLKAPKLELISFSEVTLKVRLLKDFHVSAGDKEYLKLYSLVQPDKSFHTFALYSTVILCWFLERVI